MPQFAYGQRLIEWQFQLEPQLKRHYVTVEKDRPVLLRGADIPLDKQEALIRQRARWICEKLALVHQQQTEALIVTGSRLRYCGRSYYTEVRQVPGLRKVQIGFTASRFIVECPEGVTLTPERLAPMLEVFYRERAHSKLLARLRQLEKKTGLTSRGGRIRTFQSRWASCDAYNILEFHPRVMEFSPAVQDYIIVHELCHTVEKGHTKAFWALVAQHMPDWQQYHQALERAGAAWEV